MTSIFFILLFFLILYTFGSILKKPVTINNKVLLRDILNITAMFNHKMVDGAPAERFSNRLKRIMRVHFLCNNL